MKVFLDASVLIAAAASKHGASQHIIILVRKRKIIAYISPIVIQETVKNLKEKFPKEVLVEFLTNLPKSNLQKIQFLTEEELLEYRGMTHQKDLHVIAGAHRAKVDHLLTLDKKHLLSLKDKNMPFQILTPKDFLKIHFA